MLQAMNTGHEGSMTTVHANTPRDALSRIETMVLMAGYELPVRAIREQVASALDLVLQVSRMPDGKRVITAVTELQGMEGDIILLQDIFKFRPLPGSPSSGELVPTGLRPKFLDKLRDADVEVPASAFKAPANATDRMAAAGIRNRRVSVPTPREIADREERR
jgi:pilus assembly protein CpaF